MKKEKIVPFLQKYGLVIITGIFVIVLASISPTFLTGRNIINVLRQISINGILAIGITFVIITAGIDLSVGSLVAVSSVICGSIIFKNPDNIFLAITLGILSTAILGFITGSMTALLKLPSFIASLAMMTVARGIALVYSNGRPFVLSSDAFKFLGQGYIGIMPVPVLVLFLVVAVSFVTLKYTKIGRYIYAVGGNENAAIVSGVSSKKVIISVFTISGALAGLAGVVLSSRINSGQPAIGTGYELDAIAAVVIGGTSLRGGTGRIVGTVLGVLIIGIINNGLNLMNVSSYYQLIVKGVIIAGAVMMDQITKK